MSDGFNSTKRKKRDTQPDSALLLRCIFSKIFGRPFGPIRVFKRGNRHVFAKSGDLGNVVNSKNYQSNI